jgi:hypothetical protein
MIIKAPARRAIAFAPDAGSISGVVIAAAAMLEAPMQRSAKPAIFIKFLDIRYVILRIKMVKLSEYRGRNPWCLRRILLVLPLESSRNQVGWETGDF